MTVLIAVPVFRVGCKVGIDRGRAWSAIEEVVLWAMTRQSKTVSDLARETDLPRQLIIASIARLMRFRLVEVTPKDGAVAFRASQYGFKAVSSGNPLPFFPKRVSRRVSFVIEWATGDFFPTRQVTRLLSNYKLDLERQAGAEVRVVSVEGGGPSMSHQTNLNRLSEIAARGWDEQVALVDGRTATMRDDEFMVLRVIDGEAQGIPESAGPALRKLIAEAAALPAGTTQVPVTYSGPREVVDTEPMSHPCSFDQKDLIIGGSAHRECLEAMLGQAHRRMIIHSTFLDSKRLPILLDAIKAACSRGVQFDLLWGAERDEETEKRNSVAASEIAKLVREDPVTKGKFTVHMRSTGSHAKLILFDTADDGWIAAVGSCNWLSSPFQSVELSLMLRDQRVMADLAVTVQRLVGRRGLADDIANEMALVARELRRHAASDGAARIAIVTGEMHDALVRRASGALRRFLVGSHRLGSTARPGAIMQGEAAAGRSGVKATVLYTQTSGPLKSRHAKALEQEAEGNGLILRKTRNPPLHGKFVAWDDDDVVVTSLNLASAASDPDFPWGDIGVHIQARGIAAALAARLEAIFPELREGKTGEAA
jgi:phospholipase D-like protein